MELSTYFRINAKETGQFERTLIIAEEGASVSYLEGCTAPMRDENQLHAAVVELVALDDATITLDLGSLNGTTRVPRDAITAVEVSRRRGRKRKGALLGALVGLGIAATLGAMNGESCEYPPIESRPGGLSVPYDGDCFGPAQVAGILSMLTVPVGALVGFAVSPGEEWEGVSPPGPWRVTVAPVRGGGLRAAFVLGF
jgi:hypothetical protein